MDGAAPAAIEAMLQLAGEVGDAQSVDVPATGSAMESTAIVKGANCMLV